MKNGSGRCYRCGGKSLRGINHPNYKGGISSRYVPKGFLESYKRIAADPEIAGLRHELAVLDCRLDELLVHLDEPVAGGVPPQELMARLGELWKRYEDDQSRNAYQEIAELIAGGQKVAELWREARELIDLRRKTAESESRRTERKAGMMTREEAAALIAAVVTAIRKHEDDERKLVAISRELEALTLGADGVVM